MYRVYDTLKKKWIEDKFYISPNPYSELYVGKRSLFGRIKLYPITNDRYVIHKAIDLYDKDGVLIYEGDYVKAQISEDEIVVGLVAYAHELSAYVILSTSGSDLEENHVVGTYYTLGKNVCKYIEVIGNVFDGKKE